MLNIYLCYTFDLLLSKNIVYLICLLYLNTISISVIYFIHFLRVCVFSVLFIYFCVLTWLFTQKYLNFINYAADITSSVTSIEATTIALS